MERFEPTDRTKVRRLPERGAYDRDTVHAVLDAAPIVHAGFVQDAQPFVLPMIHGRAGDTLYLHGAAGGRGLRALRSGTPLCVTATIVDGLVLARSAFHHSMNYRCVVLLGAASEVSEPAEKLKALEAISEHVLPGRWADVRPPNPAEMKQTLVVSVPLKECSAKVRTGPPKDDEEDYALKMWAGTVPVSLAYGAPVPDEKLRSGTPVPGYLSRRAPSPR